MTTTYRSSESTTTTKRLAHPWSALVLQILMLSLTAWLVMLSLGLLAGDGVAVPALGFWTCWVCLNAVNMVVACFRRNRG